MVTLEVGVAAVDMDAAYAFLKDGGIMAGVSSLGRGFPRTFSATRNMANANCSALRRPVLEMSQRFLSKLTGTFTYHNIVLLTVCMLSKADQFTSSANV